MNQPIFKPGDKVKCIEWNMTELYPRKIYIIKDFALAGEVYSKDNAVLLEEKDVTGHWWCADRFVKVMPDIYAED